MLPCRGPQTPSRTSQTTCCIGIRLRTAHSQVSRLFPRTHTRIPVAREVLPTTTNLRQLIRPGTNRRQVVPYPSRSPREGAVVASFLLVEVEAVRRHPQRLHPCLLPQLLPQLPLRRVRWRHQALRRGHQLVRFRRFRNALRHLPKILVLDLVQVMSACSRSFSRPTPLSIPKASYPGTLVLQRNAQSSGSRPNTASHRWDTPVLRLVPSSTRCSEGNMRAKNRPALCGAVFCCYEFLRLGAGRTPCAPNLVCLAMTWGALFISVHNSYVLCVTFFVEWAYCSLINSTLKNY